MRNLFRYIGLRHLQFQFIRTILTSLGVSLGVALFVAIQIINRSTIESFKENIEDISGKAAIVVTAGEVGFSEDKLAIIEKTIGVKHAVPMVEQRAFFAQKATTETLNILGVDLLKEQSVRTYKTSDEQVMDDPLVFLNQPDSVILTHQFAELHHLKVDDELSLATANGAKTLKVRGLLTPEGPARAYGGALAIMDIDGARMTFGKEGKLDRVDVVADENENINTLIERLNKNLGPGFTVERPESQAEGMERLIKTYQSLLSFFSTMALLVGLFLVTNSVSISVAERKREIGVLRALGATRPGILTLFLSEAFVMGAVGSFVGIWLGRLMADHLLELVTTSMSMQYLTSITATKVFFGTPEIVKGMLIGSGASIFAAAWPSYKATYIQPLEAMKKTDLISGAAKKIKIFDISAIAGFFMVLYIWCSSHFLWAAKSHFAEIIEEGCGIVGPALLGPALVAFLIIGTRKGASRLIRSPVTRLAEDNLLQNPKRTGSNVTTLMVGLVLVMIVSALNISFRKSIIGWFDKILKADVLVSSYGRIMEYQVQPIDEKLGPELEKLPGVLIGPERGAYGTRFIHLQFEGKQVSLKAFDKPNPQDHYALFNTKDRAPDEAGDDLYLSSEPTILVSENFVLHFHRATGEFLDLDTPSGRIKFKIVGVVTDYASPEGVFYLSRNNYKKYWNDSLVSAFGMKARPGFNPADLRREIDQKFGKSRNLMSVSNAEMREDIDRGVNQSFGYTRAIEAAALLVALLSLLNTFLISVMERTRELGVLRAVGMSQRQMMSMILQEALIQGGFGAIVAVALGVWISKLYIMGSLSYALGWIVDFYFPWQAVFTTVFLGVAVTLIAGFYPAWRAARIEIREALDYE